MEVRKVKKEWLGQMKNTPICGMVDDILKHEVQHKEEIMEKLLGLYNTLHLEVYLAERVYAVLNYVYNMIVMQEISKDGYKAELILNGVDIIEDLRAMDKSQVIALVDEYRWEPVPLKEAKAASELVQSLIQRKCEGEEIDAEIYDNMLKKKLAKWDIELEKVDYIYRSKADVMEEYNRVKESIIYDIKFIVEGIGSYE